MISYLVGEIVSKSDNSIILDVNGVGYELFVSSFSLDSFPVIGSITKVFTYMNIREDEIILFGFSSIEEKNIFLKLISVSGIGPKVAVAILSGIKISELIIAIKTGNIKILSSIKGLGKKTAERIILELKDKVDIVGYENVEHDNINKENLIDEAIEALIVLGINKNDAYKMVRNNIQGCDTTEDIIRKVFQNLNN